MKIIMHDNSLTERGTTVALFDYAFFLREYLNAETIIVYNKIYKSNPEAILKFLGSKFEVVGYDDFNEVEHLISNRGANYFYAIKYGFNDGIYSKQCRNLVHSVFCADTAETHGDRYKVVSEWLSMKSGIGYVPHMLNLPDVEDDLRKELNISPDDLVIGRYGGYDTFNIDFVKEEIRSILEKRSDIVFLFMNTEEFIEHERVHFMWSSTDVVWKKKFINTCDAMLHARDYGETFGLSVLEFAASNKRIISYDNENLQSNHSLGGRNHFLYLGENCDKYTNREDLRYLLENIERTNPYDTSYLREMFSPRVVMNKFESEFLK